MKKQILNILIISVFFSLFNALWAKDQGNDSSSYRGQRVVSQADSCEVKKVHGFDKADGTEVNIYFSSPVDPKSLTGGKLVINGKKQSDSLKITFNREGTQARFFVAEKLPFTLKIESVKSVSGVITSAVTVQVKESSGLYK